MEEIFFFNYQRGWGMNSTTLTDLLHVMRLRTEIMEALEQDKERVVT